MHRIGNSLKKSMSARGIEHAAATVITSGTQAG
jgi:hypothetical protein